MPPSFFERLRAAGYHTGVKGKGWGPGGLLWSNEHRLLTGPSFGSIDAFLRERPSRDAPWAFWLGAQQTHRVFGGDCWKCAGRPAGADDEWVRWGAPEWLPDVPRVRADVHAHSLCIECFDKSVGDAIGTLRRAAQYERTIVVMTSDHGVPFPRAKGSLYDAGTKVGLVVRAGREVSGRRRAGAAG
eukprot:1263716-Prymnesium_polylepis.2